MGSLFNRSDASEIIVRETVTEKVTLADALPYAVNTNIFVPANFIAGVHQFATLNAAMTHVKNKGMSAGIEVTITLENGTDRTGDHFVPINKRVHVRAETMPLNFETMRDDFTLTNLVSNDNTNLANNIADHATNEALAESRMNVILRYANGEAIELDGDKLGLISGIMIVGTSGNSAIGLKCGGLGGTTGNGSGILFEDCVISGFRAKQGITSDNGGAWKATDQGLIVMYCGVNVQFQFEGNGHCKGFVCLGATLHNIFYKELGMGYFPGENFSANYRSLISHALFSNVSLTLGGNHHGIVSDYGPCGGTSVQANEGGNFKGDDSTIYGALADGIRSYSGRFSFKRGQMMDIGTFGARIGMGSHNYFEGAAIGECGSLAMIIEGGEITTGNDATGYLTIANDNGGIENKGGDIKGKVVFDHAVGSDETNILSFIRHIAGTTEIDATFLIASTTSVRTVYAPRYAKGTLDIRGATVAGVTMTSADVLIRTAANTNSVPVAQSDGVNLYDTGLLLAMVG